MTILTSKILKVLKSPKINVFLLFLVLAFAILILTKLSNVYTNTIALDTVPENIPEAVIVLNDSTHKLKVTLSTHGFKWWQYYMDPPVLSIDFVNDVNKTDSEFIWNRANGTPNINAQFDKSVIIKSINPDTLKFPYDVNGIKMVPIKANAILDFSSGYDVLDQVRTQPDSVKLIGPASILDTINFIETDVLKLTDVRSSIKTTLALKVDAINPKVEFSLQEVSLEANVEKFTEGTVKIPVHIINVPKGTTLKYFPKYISVSYYTSLKAFNNIADNDFKVVCDYKKLADNNTFLIPKLVKQPDSVKSTRLHQQKIEFIITK